MSSPKRIRWYKVYESIEAVLNAFPNRRVVKVMAGNKFVCFTRNDRNFYAFGDQCPHQGKQLIHGACTENGSIVCPFHQYKFDLETGRGHGLYLPVYPVEVREDGVFVGIEKGSWDFF